MKAYKIGESIIFSSCLSSARLLAFSRCERYQHMSEVEKGEEIPWLSGMQKEKGLADHSACAALFGFCECSACSSQGTHYHREAQQSLVDVDEWHLWTIRSPYAGPLTEHRQEMMDMGFTVGPIQIADGTTGTPKGAYTFSARIPREALSSAEFDALCEWDRKYER